MKEEELQKLLKDAESVMQQGDKDKAIVLYEDIISKDPNNAEAHLKLADLYSEKGFKEKASNELLLLGNAYYESRLFKNALRFFQRVLESDPSCIEARTKAAEIYVNQEMEREAKLEYFAIAEHYLSANDLNKAEEFSKKAIDLNSIEAHYIMGLVYYKREMWKEAITEFETLTRIKLNHVSAFIHLASAMSNVGKYTEAIVNYEKVLKLEQNNVDALRGLGEAYFKKGSAKEGLDYFLSAIDIMTGNSQIDDAIKVSQDVVKLSPVSADAHLKLGALFEKKEKMQDAANEYVIAGDMFAKSKADVKAKECYERASKLDPNVGRKAGKVGTQEQVKQEPVKPSVTPQPPSVKEEPQIEKIVKQEIPKPPLVKEEEIETVTPLTEAKGDVVELFNQAEKYMKDSFFEKAIEIYRVILRKEPRNTVVRTKLHQAYLLLAQQEEEITKKTQPEGKGTKEKKSKISYL